MTDCIFCKIATGEIPAELIYEDEDVVAFNDLNPKAPTHFLVIPRAHIATLNDLTADQIPLIGKMYGAAIDLAKQLGVAEDGYRTVFNCNASAGQSVFHVHLHLLAGRQMSWPPG
jgi:histidine triad (HIT) family protein